jgi:hypothetical protein
MQLNDFIHIRFERLLITNAWLELQQYIFYNPI